MDTASMEKVIGDWRAFAEIGRALQANARRGRARAIPFLESFPAMRGFLSTFSTVAWQDAPDVPPEWNPLAQRILLRRRPRAVTELGADFEALEYAVTGAMHLVHEACHVLTWEPLFVGALPPPDAARFVELSLGFEGFCFWYPDIVVARALRDRYPNGDVVLARRGASSSHFSPHLAFEALGIRSAGEIRRLYVEAFSGLATPLASAEGLSHAASRSLARRIYGFYTDGKLDVGRMHAELSAVDLFGGFARRFWVPGLPSVLPDALLARVSRLGVSEYCDELAGAGFRAMAALDEPRRSAVALRRAVQTRAYFAWTLRHVLRERLFVGDAGGIDAIDDALDAHLLRLEGMLRAPTAPALAAADRRYQREVRAPLLRAGLWMRARRQLFPRGEPWGPLPPSQATPARCRRALARCLELARALSTRGRPVPAALRELCRLPADHADRARWARAHERFMHDADVLPLWSVALADLDPLRGRFRELSFVYH